MRINKYLAECGVASRRNADIIIKEGRVCVNNKKIDACGIDIDVEYDRVSVDGKAVKLPANFTYILFNKPKGCICSLADEKGRKTIFDYVPSDNRVFPVGRLDYDSEGMLIITNDGAMADRLTHPRNETPKTYSVKIEGEIAENELALLRSGVEMDGKMTKKCKLKVVEYANKITKMEMTIYEGRNRQIRKMFEVIQKNVIFLKRIAIGELRLGGLGRGKWRNLNENEIFYLQNI